MSGAIVPIKQISPIRALKKFTADAENVAERFSELQKLGYAARQQQAMLERGEVVYDLVDGRRAALTRYDEVVLARCIEQRDQLDPEHNYEDSDREEGDLRRDVMSLRLAVLTGSFPSGAPADPNVYTAAMLGHVAAIEGLNLLALDAACHALVASKKFLPTISELIGELTEQLDRWWTRLNAINSLRAVSRATVTEIAELQTTAEKVTKTRAVKWARREHSMAVAEAVKAQQQAAVAAQAVADKLAALVPLEARVLEAERALARIAGKLPP